MRFYYYGFSFVKDFSISTNLLSKYQISVNYHLHKSIFHISSKASLLHCHHINYC